MVLQGMERILVALVSLSRITSVQVSEHHVKVRDHRVTSMDDFFDSHLSSLELGTRNSQRHGVR